MGRSTGVMCWGLLEYLDEATVTAHRPHRPTIDISDFDLTVQLDYSTPELAGGGREGDEPQTQQARTPPQKCYASRANNPRAGRNMLMNAIAGAGIAGTVYTAIALANLEDGAGEVMVALRAAQVARFGANEMMVSDVLGGSARVGGAADVIIAFFSGGGIGFGVGTGVGLLSTSAVCVGK